MFIEEISYLGLLVVALWDLVVGDVNKAHLRFFFSELCIKDLEHNERMFVRKLVKKKIYQLPLLLKMSGCT